MNPLVELIVGAFAILALKIADVGEVGLGEYIGQQFEHVAGSVLRYRGVLVGLAYVVSKEMELQVEVVVKRPATEGLDIRLPLHAIGHIDADGLAEDVNQGAMGEIVEHTVARGNGKLVALGLEFLDHLAGLAAV